MKSKRAIMGFAALLIVVFHLYIPFSDNGLEKFFYRSGYIGVDLFFFVSAYSLSIQTDFDWKKLYINRFKKVYLPFVGMALISAFYNGWKFKKFLLVITGIEFFKKGGGAFLWFFTGIMIFYLISPLLIWAKRQAGIKALPLLLLGWLGIVFVLQYILSYTAIFILLNRLPVFLFGLFGEDIRRRCSGMLKIAFLSVGLVLGTALIYFYGIGPRLGKPIVDIYYVLALPLTLALVGLFEIMISHFSLRLRVLEFLGGLTAEYYAFQMIFGFDIESALTKIIGATPLVFLITAVILAGIAYLFNLFVSTLEKAIKIRRIQL